MSFELQFTPVDPEKIDVTTYPLTKSENVSTMVLEPKWLYNQGIIGWCDTKHAYIYDYDKLIIALSFHWKCDEQDAIDHLHYNTMGTIDYILHCQPNLQTCIIVEKMDENKYIILSGVEIEDLDEPVIMNMIGEEPCDQPNPA